MGTSSQYITFSINSSVMVLAIYAKYRYLERRELWSNLIEESPSNNLPYVIIGDLNVIRED